jgi:CheY-like chemotaxis protein
MHNIMSAISIFSSSFCKADQVAQEVFASTGYKVIPDESIVSDASALSGISSEKIARAFAAKTSVFNKFTHEKECSVAYLKLAAAKRMIEDNIIINGFSSQLIPNNISHLLRVALIGDLPYRLAEAAASQSLSEKEAQKQMRIDDENCAAWVEFIFRNHQECWDPDRYDLFIPMHKTSLEQSSAWIAGNVLKPVVQPTETSKQMLEDFHLAAKVGVALALEGHNVDVAAKGLDVTLSLNKQVLLRGRLEEELRSIANNIKGVDSVTIKTGHDYHQANIYRKHDFSIPSRVLLVDDERDLVQTLSERLQMRDMGSAVAYDGESALQLVQNDDPEVMIIDLKMPGIDGLEVLRQVKETRPEIEVIILTGKGSKADEVQCRKLGAFGFLQKPVDIEELSNLLKQAHEKIQRRQPLREQK